MKFWGTVLHAQREGVLLILLVLSHDVRDGIGVLKERTSYVDFDMLEVNMKVPLLQADVTAYCCS